MTDAQGKPCADPICIKEDLSGLYRKYTTNLDFEDDEDNTSNSTDKKDKTSNPADVKSLDSQKQENHYR